MDDARLLHRGKYSAWVTKKKSDRAKAKWLMKSTKRLFTIDFDCGTLYYRHADSESKVSGLVPFRDILGATLLPVNPEEESGRRRFSLTGEKAQEYGFTVNTKTRHMELAVAIWLDAKRWVDALNAAAEMVRTPVGDMTGAATDIQRTSSSPTIQRYDSEATIQQSASEDNLELLCNECLHSKHLEGCNLPVPYEGDVAKLSEFPVVSSSMSNHSISDNDLIYVLPDKFQMTDGDRGCDLLRNAAMITAFRKASTPDLR